MQGAIPDDVNTLVFKFQGMVGAISLADNKAGGLASQELIVHSSMFSDENNIFSFYILGMPEDRSFRLSVVGKNIIGEPLFDEKIEVPIQVFANKITELTGPLFSDQSTDAGANITISDPSWDDDKIIINL